MDTLYKILTLIWKNGISEADFCEAIGINKSAVTDWKKGKTKSYVKHIDKIANYFGVTTDYLLGNSESKTPPEYDSFIEMQNAISRIEESKANTYTVHGSQGRGTVVKSTTKKNCSLIGNGKTYELTQTEFVALESVIKAMRNEIRD